MTIIPFAAARCIDCKAPVAIVRRTVEVPCGPLEPLPCGCEAKVHGHAIPDVGPPTLVDEDGIRHECVDTVAYDAGIEEARVTGGPSARTSLGDPVRVL